MALGGCFGQLVDGVFMILGILQKEQVGGWGRDQEFCIVRFNLIR